MWRKRCLVIVPVLGFIMAALLLSCGSSSTTTTPVPTSTPVTLVVLRICSKQPPTGTACPAPTPVALPTSQKFSLFAQGQFSSNGEQTYKDITQTASWFSSSSAVTVLKYSSSSKGERLTTGTTSGCACITAASGSVLSSPLKVTVGSPATPCKSCPVP